MAPSAARFAKARHDTKKADGSRLKLNDPEFAPIWETAARLNIPVIIDTGDPPEFFKPLDIHNERWLELALFPTDADTRARQVETLAAERNRLFERHPKTSFVAAHFAWHAKDMAARQSSWTRTRTSSSSWRDAYNLGRQPRAAHEFFVNDQDRMLFGKDTYASEFPDDWRVFETPDEYFDYYREYHASWKMDGIGSAGCGVAEGGLPERAACDARAARP